MAYDPHKHHRRSIRLTGYDYSQDGLYFITIVVKKGLCLFGDVVEGEMRLNDAGQMVEEQWLELPGRFPQVELDVFQVIPNHFHGILGIRNPDPASGLAPAQERADDGVGTGPVPAQERATTRVAPTIVVRDMVGAFKSITTNKYITGVKGSVWTAFPGKLWQRNYYEHIIRNERSLNAIREYIINNPANWTADQLHPNAPPNKFNAAWQEK